MVLPEEEIKIKEIEEIVETTEPVGEEIKPTKKAHVKRATEEKPIMRKRA